MINVATGVAPPIRPSSRRAPRRLGARAGRLARRRSARGSARKAINLYYWICHSGPAPLSTPVPITLVHEPDGDGTGGVPPEEVGLGVRVVVSHALDGPVSG